MSVTLDGGFGLFDRVGALAGRINDIVALIGGSATARVLSTANMVTKFDDILDLYAGGTAINSTFDGAYNSLAAWQSAQVGLMQQLSTIGANTVIRMVDEDNPLKQKTLAVAMKELIRQMVANSETVNATEPAAGSQTNVGTPTGTPVVVVSLKNGAGATMEYVFAETLLFTCTSDAQTGGATAGQETVQVTGKTAASTSFAYNWPLGSGASTSLSITDAEQNNDGKNLLYNSSFESWCSDSAHTPQNWTVTVGTAATTIFNGGSSDAYDGSGCLKLTGDGGGTLSALTHQFDHATATTAGNGGTPAELEPETPYALTAWYKVSATPAAGVIEFSLVDGSGTTIADSAGTNNLTTQSLTSTSTTYLKFSTTFRLPAVLPSTVKLKVRLSTAIDSGKSVFIDRVALTPMTQLYAGGPYVAVASGATDMVLNDAWTIAVTVSSTGAIQKAFDRMFNMRSLGLQLPSATGAAETLDDAMVA